MAHSQLSQWENVSLKENRFIFIRTGEGGGRECAGKWCARVAVNYGGRGVGSTVSLEKKWRRTDGQKEWSGRSDVLMSANTENKKL